MSPSLCLGTAQFGLSYGITNTNGQVSEVEVAHLLYEANSFGIRYLDTAQSYGNSEEVLGRNLPTGHKFRIGSKLSAQSQFSFSSSDIDVWEKNFHSSCKRLGLNSLDYLLLHSPADLKKKGSDYLIRWLSQLRNRGLVDRIGLSIYTSDDLEGIDLDLLDLVQLPLSLFDQRLLKDGTIYSLNSRGINVHARSLYLQGILLTPPSKLPDWVGAQMRNHHTELETLAQKKNCRLVDLALGFAKVQNDLEAVVVGLCSSKELLDLKIGWEANSPWDYREWENWSLQDPNILDPRRWPT
ncbi:putative oxidoreductase [Synechococcus sp. A18-40]|nr:putative oxidoreductase [Synechococcus sp. A18-40]